MRSGRSGNVSRPTDAKFQGSSYQKSRESKYGEEFEMTTYEEGEYIISAKPNFKGRRQDFPD
jgi:hypothetical protein